MSHTPGPWYVAVAEDPSSAWAEGKTEDSFVIRSDESAIEVLGETIAAVPDSRPDNAFLISAAPDLLSACQSALKLFGNTKAPLVDEIRAAVAKATGGK